MLKKRREEELGWKEVIRRLLEGIETKMLGVIDLSVGIARGLMRNWYVQGHVCLISDTSWFPRKWRKK